MTMTDPVADMFTSIRNALQIDKPAVTVPASKLKIDIARVLKEEGFILDFETRGELQGDLCLRLKYTPEGTSVISGIERVSKPGRRAYAGCDEIAPVLRGLGITIVSTSKGVMSGNQCREQRVGGEILGRVW